MVHLIDKTAVVEELERLYNLEYDNTSNLSCGKKIMLRNILHFLDTFEVKEVDLEKHLKEDIEDVFFDLDGVAVKGATHYLTIEDDIRRRSTIQVLEYARSLDTYNQYGKADIDKNIAWLEKQGQQSIKWNKNTKENKPQVNHSVLMKTSYGIVEGEWNGDDSWIQYRWASSVKDSDVLFWIKLSDLEEQGKQKPIIEMKTPEESLGIDSDTYNKIVDECIYGEQKPCGWKEKQGESMKQKMEE